MTGPVTEIGVPSNFAFLKTSHAKIYRQLVKGPLRSKTIPSYGYKYDKEVHPIYQE